jgi:predicted AAA+ superfamily ATPase
MTEALFYPRWQLSNLRIALETRRIVLISGARQTGKSTLAKEVTVPHTEYRTLDDDLMLRAASSNYQAFLKHSGRSLIIDEIQKEPGLIPAIKMAVDESNEPGQFILTGSASLSALPNVTESLAGRIRSIRLRPLTQGEILERQPTFVNKAFGEDFPKPDKQFDQDTILSLAFRGGYPEAVRLPIQARADWYGDYLEALLDRDLQYISQIKRRHEMRGLVQALAAWSSKLMDLSAVGGSLELSRPTLNSYINALEALYLFDRLPAWAKGDYARVGKQDKLFMCDTGLLTATLRWTQEESRFADDRLGKLIETFVYTQLAAEVDVLGRDYSLYHYRDRDRHEIDFLIERHDGAILAMEVKAGANVTSKQFSHLRWFNEKYKPCHFVGVVFHTGNQLVSFGENLWAVPIASLWGNT